ncbi:MAG: VCBS repeat-containing protein [Candidatus Kerfeldbacteria bacterium]|nr:VCBS repeat-containing protein [Candidatus Kerfeldbacteria bacterium]
MKRLRSRFAIAYGSLSLLLVLFVLIVHFGTPTVAQVPWNSGRIDLEYHIDDDDLLPFSPCDITNAGGPTDCMTYGLDAYHVGPDYDYNTTLPRLGIDCATGPERCYGIFRTVGGTPRAFARMVSTGTDFPVGTAEYYLTFTGEYDAAQTSERLEVLVCDDALGSDPLHRGDESSQCTSIATSDDMGTGSVTCTFPRAIELNERSILAFRAAGSDDTQDLRVDWYQLTEEAPLGSTSCVIGRRVGGDLVSDVRGWAWVGTSVDDPTNTVGWVNFNCSNQYYNPSTGGISVEQRCASQGYVDFGMKAYWGNNDQGVIPLCGEAWVGDGDPNQSVAGTTCTTDSSNCRSTGWLSFDPGKNGGPPDGEEFFASVGNMDFGETWNGYGFMFIENYGNGEFQSTSSAVNCGGGGFTAMAAADMNNDQTVDYVTADLAAGVWYTSGASLHAPLGNLLGVASFTPSSQVNVITLADFDEDGVLDILLGTVGRNELVHGTGLSEFLSRVWQDDPAASANTWATAAADFDHDGHLDFVAANENAPARVYWGNGDGTFDPPTVLSPTTQGWGIATAFVNDTDTYRDVLLYTSDANNPRVLLLRYDGGGSRTFTLAASVDVDPNSTTNVGFAVGYLNDDPYVDFVVGGNTGTSPYTTVYLTNGGYDTFTETPLPESLYTLAQNGIVITDVDRDLSNDVVLANPLGQPAWDDDALFAGFNYVYYGDGRGNFSNPRPMYGLRYGYVSSTCGTRTLVAADFALDEDVPARRCSAAIVAQDRGPYTVGEVIGWGRISSLKEYGESLSPDSNDWGWMGFHGGWCGAGSPGDATYACVSYSPVNRSFDGYAWSAGGTKPGTSVYAQDLGLGWIDFSFGAFTTPYFTTQRGDVYTQRDIDVGVPEDLPTEQYGATFLIQAGGSIVQFPSESGSTFEFPGYDVIPFPTAVDRFANVLGRIDEAGILSGRYAEVRDISLLPTNGSLDGAVYRCAAPCTYTVPASGLEFDNAVPSSGQSGNGLIFIDGDLTINGPVTYGSSGNPLTSIRELASVGWIVKGDVTVDPDVEDLVGAFAVLGEDGNPATGTFSSSASTSQLRVHGLILARAFDLQRTFIGGTFGVPEPSELITYDGRVFANAPPGMADLSQSLPEYRLVAP